jgi:hypothetical protein
VRFGGDTTGVAAGGAAGIPGAAFFFAGALFLAGAFFFGVFGVAV